MMPWLQVKCSPREQESDACTVHGHSFVTNRVRVPAMPEDLVLMSTWVKKMLLFVSLENLHGKEPVTSSVLKLVKSCPHLNRRGLLVPALCFARTTLTFILSGRLLFSMLYICLTVMVSRGPFSKLEISVTRMSK